MGTGERIQDDHAGGSILERLNCGHVPSCLCLRIKAVIPLSATLNCGQAGLAGQLG